MSFSMALIATSNISLTKEGPHPEMRSLFWLRGRELEQDGGPQAIKKAPVAPFSARGQSPVIRIKSPLGSMPQRTFLILIDQVFICLCRVFRRSGLTSRPDAPGSPGGSPRPGHG